MPDLLHLLPEVSDSPQLRHGSFPHLSIGQRSNHSEESISQAEVVEEFIHDDAEKLREHFKSAFVKMQETMARPFVLIAGRTGAGKR